MLLARVEPLQKGHDSARRFLDSLAMRTCQQARASVQRPVVSPTGSASQTRRLAYSPNSTTRFSWPREGCKLCAHVTSKPFLMEIVGDEEIKDRHALVLILDVGDRATFGPASIGSNHAHDELVIDAKPHGQTPSPEMCCGGRMFSMVVGRLCHKQRIKRECWDIPAPRTAR